MPTGANGQQITFASQLDPDQKYTQYVHVRAQRNDTISKIASRRGQPELVPEILTLNRNVRLKNGHFLRSARQVLRTGVLIRLPGTLSQKDVFSVTCGEERPVIKDGYAMFDTVARPGRVGLSRFLGYNPIQIDIPIQFEGFAQAGGGDLIEANIAKLERMAGRGNYGGAADGPPAVVRVSVTDAYGRVVPLVPLNYQWSAKNPTAPLYRIAGITWDPGALSDDQGRRVRASATVTVKQYTPLTQIKRSATQRARAKGQ
jgi:hypothetical protein